MQAERRRKAAACERPERNRSPHDPAHGRVHATLEALRSNRLAETDLRDVVRDRAELHHEESDDENRKWERPRRERKGKPAD